LSFQDRAKSTFSAALRQRRNDNEEVCIFNVEDIKLFKELMMKMKKQRIEEKEPAKLLRKRQLSLYDMFLLALPLLVVLLLLHVSRNKPSVPDLGGSTYCANIQDHDLKFECYGRTGNPNACYQINNQDTKLYCLALAN
jgi:hypothetical protein